MMKIDQPSEKTPVIIRRVTNLDDGKEWHLVIDPLTSTRIEKFSTQEDATRWVSQHPSYTLVP